MIEPTIVFLSGGMTGQPDYNKPAFKLMEDRLTERGCTVINPAILPLGLSDEAYMDITLAMVRSCDTVVMLDGWEESGGALAEFMLAKRLGKRVIEQCGEHLQPLV